MGCGGTPTLHGNGCVSWRADTCFSLTVDLDIWRCVGGCVWCLLAYLHWMEISTQLCVCDNECACKSAFMCVNERQLLIQSSKLSSFDHGHSHHVNLCALSLQSLNSFKNERGYERAFTTRTAYSVCHMPLKLRDRQKWVRERWIVSESFYELILCCINPLLKVVYDLSMPLVCV